jgi:chromosome segregation protein
MLKLHRLEVSGFKSFVDPVEVDFAGGITGIVGPNGCGKSNLSDAITWVLGEQSAKSMRGETMEDVIFNGSEKRKPLGMGEVTLTFLADASEVGGVPSAGERAALAENDGRMTISRRVFRSGESQYRLNGKVVRLKEIKDLLMDTGLGIRAYSVIEQGKIGLILSGKPQERRRLIEEAAGITRYKARKKIAEVKLEEATANLLRIDDIVQEVERNLRSLKRQAGAARRYQEKRAEQGDLLRRVLGGRWARLSAELASARIDVGEAQTVESDRAATIHRLEAELAAERERVERSGGELSDRSRRHAELGATIEGRQQFLTGGRRTVAEIDARAAAGEAIAARQRELLDGYAAALESLAADTLKLVGEHDAAAALVEADGQTLRAAEESARLVEERLEQTRQELLASLNDLNALRTRLHREQIESEKGSFRQRHLFDEIAARGTELAEATRALADASARLATLENQIGEKEADYVNADGALSELLEREAAAVEALRALETERALRGERQRFLAELADGERERGAAFAVRLEALGLAQPSLLGGRIRALRGWEKALDLYLGDLVEAVVLEEPGSARDWAARAAAEGRGGGTLVSPIAEALDFAAPSDPAIVASLGAALGLDAAIARALPPAFLVDSAEDAERLARRHAGAAFLTRDRIWAEGGLVHLAGDETQPGFLARASELADLAEELPRLEARELTGRGELEALVAARSSAAEALNRLRESIAALKQEQAGLRSRRDELAGRHRRLAEHEDTLQREQTTLATELSRLGSVQHDLGAELQRLEQLHAGRERAFDELQAAAVEARRDREAQRALGAGRRGQLDVLSERLGSLSRDRARLERESESARRALADWTQEAAALAERRAELGAKMGTAEVELQEALELKAFGEENLRDSAEALELERQGVRDRESNLAFARADHDAARRKVEELRILLAGLEHDCAHLAGEFAEQLGEAPPEIPGEVPANLAELETDLARLKEQLEAIGPVNVLAAEEYASEEERHTFLSTQRTDVAKSVESLRATIRDINQTSSARFKEAFVQVNEQFAKTFVDLFRGGEAEMRLMDEEDLLESGIEIVARPPGKRLQNLMLMSGGEKALTAIALLFALFRIKPSPFCILDEVDAPLDDVNTLRFVGMLRELSRETQCIVITHNKLTMEVAGTLYGVTMEERGVSKLVAVQLEEVQPQAVSA